MAAIFSRLQQRAVSLVIEPLGWAMVPQVCITDPSSCNYSCHQDEWKPVASTFSLCIRHSQISAVLIYNICLTVPSYIIGTPVASIKHPIFNPICCGRLSLHALMHTSLSLLFSVPPPLFLVDHSPFSYNQMDLVAHALIVCLFINISPILPTSSSSSACPLASGGVFRVRILSSKYNYDHDIMYLNPNSMARVQLIN